MKNFNRLFAWCITDGNAGNVNQAKGLAQLLGLDFKQKDLSLNFPWNKMPLGFLPINIYLKIFTDLTYAEITWQRSAYQLSQK